MINKGLLIIVTTLFFSFSYAQEVDKYIQQLTESLASGENISGFDSPIHAKSMVADFYQLRNYQLAWDDKDLIAEVLDELKNSSLEGLSPDDYHYDQLLEIFNNPKKHTGYGRAQFELLLTDAVLLYAFHLYRGKLDPTRLSETWNYMRREPLEKEIIAGLEQQIKKGTVVEKLNEIRPNIKAYKEMKKALAFYRQLKVTSPFEKFENKPLIKPLEQSSLIPKLRQRMIDLQFLDEDEASSNIYDEKLIAAIKSFQKYHSLDADGVIGRNTWKAINLSWQQRIDMLKVNLERTRWVYRNTSENFVLVNIAGFTLYMFKDYKIIWQTEVMTGTVKNETPLFTSKFSYMEINPTWTVPWSILRKSLINKMKANPAYPLENDFVLYDREGNKVDVSTLDWSKLSPNRFPYTVVQQPGIKNALGQVKFIFPNSHAIYLHDTPSKALFSSSSRAFSHGCVRVKDPFKFAKLLLNDDEKWTEDKLTEIVQSKKRTRLSIKTPTNIMLMYWTTEAFEDDKIKFNPDIYNRDQRVLTALNLPLP